ARTGAILGPSPDGGTGAVFEPSLGPRPRSRLAPPPHPGHRSRGGRVPIRRCPQCGATVEAEAHVLSITCAFCETPLVDTDEAAERPERVAPFEVDRARAAK